MIYIATCTYNKNYIFSGHDIVLTLEELMNVIIRDDCDVIDIKKDFARKYFTPTYLNEFKNIVERFSPKTEVKIDVDYITSVNEDISIISNMRNPEELIDYLLSNREDKFKIIQDLCKKVNNISNETIQANSILSSLYMSINEKNQESDTYKNERDNTLLEFEKMRVKYNDLIGKITMMYNIPIDESKLLGYDLKYNNYTKILYIKELTHLKYTSSLVYYLQEILETIYDIPARLLVIESPYALGKTLTYNNCKSHLNLTQINVFRDNIAMAGFQSTIVGDILKNPSGVQYLIVLDRSGWDNCFIRGADVEYIYTISTYSEVYNNGIATNRIISDSEETMYIDSIESFDRLSFEKKIGNYSSMNIIRELITILEGK